MVGGVIALQVNDVKSVQSVNAPPPMFVTFIPKSTVVSFEHLSKTLLPPGPPSETMDGKLIDVKLEHLRKT